MKENLPEKTYIILFDGVCTFCNHTVQFLLEKDVEQKFMFGSLQGAFGQKFLKERNLDASCFDSIILIHPEMAYYTKSQAAFKIAALLGFPWKVLGLLQYLPTGITDFGYDLFAKNRYKFFGKQETCSIPSAEVKARFLA